MIAKHFIRNCMSTVFIIIINFQNLATLITETFTLTWFKLHLDYWTQLYNVMLMVGAAHTRPFEFHHVLRPSWWFTISHRHQPQPPLFVSVVRSEDERLIKDRVKSRRRHAGCFPTLEQDPCAGWAGGASWRAKLAIIIRQEQKLQPYLYDCRLSRFSRAGFIRPGK